MRKEAGERRTGWGGGVRAGARGRGRKGKETGFEAEEDDCHGSFGVPDSEALPCLWVPQTARGKVFLFCWREFREVKLRNYTQVQGQKPSGSLARAALLSLAGGSWLATGGHAREKAPHSRSRSAQSARAW